MVCSHIRSAGSVTIVAGTVGESSSEMEAAGASVGAGASSDELHWQTPQAQPLLSQQVMASAGGAQWPIAAGTG